MARLGGLSTSSETPVQLATTATPGASVTIDVSGNHNLWTWTAGEDETVNISGSHSAGREITFIITNDGTLPRTITFGTGFVSVAPIVGVISTRSIIGFISNGSSFFQKAAALTGM